jgi:hypothetical protein
MQYFEGNKDKKLTWSAQLFGNNKGLTGGGKADSTDDACHHQKELFAGSRRVLTTTMDDWLENLFVLAPV